MSAPRLAFGPFVLDPDERQLFREGRSVALTPRAFDVLTVLATQPGHLVTKDDLLAAAWPGVVVEENALSVAVSRLRASLGDDGRALVETVPGHGYRLTGPVAVLDTGDGADGRPAGPRVEELVLAPGGDGMAPVAPVPDRPRPRLWLVGAALVLAVLAVGALWPGRAAAPARPAFATDVPPEALVAYRRGRVLWEARQQSSLREALAQFQLARTLAPGFARAHLGEAQVYAFSYQSEAAAEAALARALALDSTLAEAWATRGFVRAFQAWDWAGAEAAFARARALDADDVVTLQWLASLRMVQRRLPQAEAALQRAVALRPEDAALQADLCEVHYYRRDLAGAEAACARALALDPDQPMARTHVEERIGLAAPAGQERAAQMLDANRADFDRFARARFHARLGQRDSALAYVAEAIEQRMFVAPFLHPDPLFDPYRDDPRWTAAMRRMGLAE